jgi:hypothetical protein
MENTETSTTTTRHPGDSEVSISVKDVVAKQGELFAHAVKLATEPIDLRDGEFITLVSARVQDDRLYMRFIRRS